MPGRLVQNSPEPSIPQNLKKERISAQTRGAIQPNAMDQTNGASSSHITNKLSDQGGSTQNDVPTSNGAAAGGSSALPGPGDPPKLNQEWRSSDSNKSLGKLIQRLAQQCQTDLVDTVTKMSEITVQPQAPQTNGASLHVIDTSESSLTKKRMLLDFADGQRDRFTKALVLSDWCRKGEGLSSLIDIKVWEESQRDAQGAAIHFVGETKNHLSLAKVPSPNIDGALELLATGKSTQYPDMGYIQPKRLTAKQLLRTLQDMNAILAERFMLHEDLPPHFNQYTIADGRATFRVSGEFEVDLTVADEDVSCQYWFIDARFCFRPATPNIDASARKIMEDQVNTALQKSGLKGCYELLHNFVLTYKLNFLRDQTNELARNDWAGCLRTELKRRVLVVQYWAGSKDIKSWIEIGFGTGKQKGRPSRKPPTPQLFAMWVRKKGSEIQRETVDFDVDNLNVEQILSSVIARHISWRFQQYRDGLVSMAGTDSILKTQIATSETDPNDCSMILSMPALSQPLTVRFEAVGGRVSISPSSPLAAQCERQINGDPSQDACKHIASLICHLVQDRIATTAGLLGWMPCFVSRRCNEKAFLGKSTLSRKNFICNRAWGLQWALISTSGLDGNGWLLAQTVPDNEDEMGRRMVLSAQRIPVAEAMGGGADLSVSRAVLLQVEKLATAEVSYIALSQQLTLANIEHRTETLSTSVSRQEGVLVGDTSPSALIISANSWMGGSHQEQEGSRPVTAIGPVRIAHLGVETAQALDLTLHAKHELRLTVAPGTLRALQERLIQNPDRCPEIAMNDSGALAIRIQTPFGQPFLDQMRTRLRSCERLDYYLHTMQKCDYRVTELGLAKLTFTYGDAHQYSATMNFQADGTYPATFSVGPKDGNPHQHLQESWERTLNQSSTTQTGFTSWLTLFSMTLPVLQDLDRLETAHGPSKTLEPPIKTIGRFTMQYKAPLPPFVFEIVYKRKNPVGGYWYLFMASPKPNAPWVPQELGQAWKELCAVKTPHWHGLPNASGLVALKSGVADAMEAIDALMRKFEGVVDPATIPSAEVSIKSEAPGAASQSAPQNPPAPGSAAARQRRATTSQSQPPPQPDSKPAQLKNPALGVPQQQQGPASAAPGSQQQPRPPAPMQMQRSTSSQVVQRPVATAAAQMQRPDSSQPPQRAQEQKPKPNGAQNRPGNSEHEVIELD